MHDSVQSDSITPLEAESQLHDEDGKSGDGAGSNSHPWCQLQSLTPFSQKILPSASSSLKDNPVRTESISRTSGSSLSSCSASDDSNDIALLKDNSIKSSQPKMCTHQSQHHSDPSHDRRLTRQGSHSNDLCSRFDGSNQSLKRKLSSTESVSRRRYNKQYSASHDERLSLASRAHNANQLAVNDTKAVCAMNNSLSSSLMIESLIDQICKMMIHDTKKQKAMYKIICNHLYKMGIISDSYSVDELQVMRNHYQKALYQIFTLGRSATQSPHQTEFLLPISSVKIDFPLSPGMMDVSRYKGEFEELEFLAKGGFGKVYRVRHRLDRALYAVKKIIFRNDDHVMKSVQEVKMLANLNHPNVVSYKAAWIEPLAPKEYENISSASTRSTGTGTDTNNSSNCFKMEMPSVHHGGGHDSVDIVFTELAGDQMECGAGDSGKNSANPCLTIESVHGKVTKRTTVSNEAGGKFERSEIESKSVVSSSISNAVQPYRSSTFPKQIRKRQVNLVVLYVQMQLCELTLRQWLDERNSCGEFNLGANVSSGIKLFQQIVRGVEYIHAQTIVHHDIKPSNIFVSNDLSLVQVGDFGLSCWFRPQLKHGCHIGTALYAAPEQLTGMCDPKSDIYSLGIVLLEILVSFSTTMERVQTIEKLRRGQCPDRLEASAPAIANLVRKLVQPNPRLRPTAAELLRELQDIERLKSVGQCSDEKTKLIHEISAKYEAVIQSKDKEIFELKKRLRELEAFQRRGEEPDSLR